MQLFRCFFFCLMALTQAWSMQDPGHGGGDECIRLNKSKSLKVDKSQLYQLDMEMVSHIKPFLSDLPPCFESHRGTLLGLDKELYREKVNVEEAIIRDVRKFCFSIRKSDVELKISTLKTLSEIQDLMLEHFKVHFSTEIEGKIKELEEGIAAIKIKAIAYYEQYKEFVELYGIKRDMPYRLFVDDLLNIKGEARTPLIQEQAHSVIKKLMSVGFIKTRYPLAKTFVYDPSVLVEAYMEKHGEVTRLILGCGHHLYTGVTDFFNVPREGFCSECNLTPFHHGDLTISLLSNDFCDVMGDMHDAKIWHVLKKRSWKLIGDHSWAASFEKRETLQAIYASLAEDGLFEVWTLPHEYRARALEVGFELFKVDEEKNLTYFKKR